MSMTRRRLLDDTFKKSVVGNPAIATDSLARRYPGIVMQGWTTQDGTPTPETPVPIVSAGTQNQETGKWEYEIEVGCGNLMEPREETNEKTTVVNNVSIQQKNMEFTISGISNTDGGRGNTFGKASLNPGNYIASIYGNIENNLTPIVNYANGRFLSGFGKIFAIVEKTDITFGFNLKQNVSYEENVKIILNPGSTALPYTPYRPPQTITLTADRPLTKWDKLEKRDGQWGWVYKSEENILDGSEDEYWKSQTDRKGKRQFYISLHNALYPYSEPFKEMFFCDTFLTTNSKGVIPNFQVRKGAKAGSLSPVFKPNDDIDKVALFRDFLAENPTTILYVTAEETFVPLTTAEQEAMNALYTYRPTTVLTNQQGCEMALTYKTRKSMEVTA